MVVFLSAFLAKRVLTAYAYPLNYSALFFIAAALLLIASLGFWRIKEISVFNSEGNGLVKFLHTITHEIRTNKKFKTYLYFVNTQGISIALMPFLILYAKENISAESHDIGNFLLLKVIGSVLTGSLLLYFSKKAKYRHMMVTTSVVAILIRHLLSLSITVIHPYRLFFPHYSDIFPTCKHSVRCRILNQE